MKLLDVYTALYEKFPPPHEAPYKQGLELAATLAPKSATAYMSRLSKLNAFKRNGEHGHRTFIMNKLTKKEIAARDKAYEKVLRANRKARTEAAFNEPDPVPTGTAAVGGEPEKEPVKQLSNGPLVQAAILIKGQPVPFVEAREIYNQLKAIFGN